MEFDYQGFGKLRELSMDVVSPGFRNISVVAWILDSKVLVASRAGVAIFLLTMSFSGHCNPVAQCVSSGVDIGCTYPI